MQTSDNIWYIYTLPTPILQNQKKSFPKHPLYATFHVTFNESIPAANSNAVKLSKDMKG